MSTEVAPHSISQKLFSEYEEIQNDLKANYRGKSCLDKSVRARRDRVQQNLVQMLLDDFEFAAEKDVEALLWRNVFYVCIEEFRARIRKAAQSRQVTDELKKATDTLKAMIEGASRFYEELLRNFKVMHRLNIDHSIPNDLDALTDSKYLVCYRVFIRLGDLARYHKDLIAHPSQGEWKKANEQYRRALRLIPSNGHAYNQLAVVATYHGDDFRTLYYYYRSLSVLKPFETSKENVVQLFYRLRKKAEKEALAQNKASAHAGKGNRATKTGNSDGSKKPSGSNMKYQTIQMLRKFLALNDILFTETKLETFDASLEVFLVEFTGILSHPDSLITEKVMLDIFEMVIFLIWRIETQSRALDRGLPDKALSLLFGLLAVVTERSQKVYQSKSSVILARFSKDRSQKEKESLVPNSTLLYYKGISIVFSFLGANKDRYLQRPKTALSSGYFQRIRAALVSIANACVELAGVDVSVDPTAIRTPTSEEADLKAFIPLQTAFAQLSNVDWSMIESQLSANNDRVRRIKMTQFAIDCSLIILDSGEPLIAFDHSINRFILPPQVSESEFPSLPGEQVRDASAKPIPETRLGKEDDFDEESFDKALQEMLNERTSNAEDLEGGSFDFKDDDDDLGDEIVFSPQSTQKITAPAVDLVSPFAQPSFNPTIAPQLWAQQSGNLEESRFASMFHSRPPALEPASSALPFFSGGNPMPFPMPMFPNFSAVGPHFPLGFSDAPPGVDVTKLSSPSPPPNQPSVPHPPGFGPTQPPPPGFGATQQTSRTPSIWDFDGGSG